MAKPQQSGTLSVTGIEETIKALDKLAFNVATKIVKDSVNKGMRVMLTAARSAAPVDTGLLRQSLGIRSKVRTSRAGGNLVFADIWVGIGPRSDVAATDERGNLKRPVKYGHFSEFGRQSQRPYPGKFWMSRVFDSHSRSALATIRSEFVRRVEELA